MAYTAILDEEFDAIECASHAAQLFYLRLRRKMHRHDGMAFGSGVTWGELAQSLHVAAGRGITDSGTPTRQKMMRLRDELMRIGVLEDLGDHKNYLKFRFPVFLQYYSAGDFCAKNIPVPKSDAYPVPKSDGTTQDNSKGYDNDLSYPIPTENAKPVLSPISHITTATTVGDAENFIAQDPIANAMLQGGMQEYHIFVGLPIISAWRQLQGFSEAATIALVKTRLAKNPSINSVNYFQGAIEQLCASTLAKPSNVTPLHQAKALSEFTLPRFDDDLPTWAKQYGYPDAPVGMTVQGYRRLLSEAIGRRKQGGAIPVPTSAKVSTASASTSSMPSKRVAFPQSISELISQL